MKTKHPYHDESMFKGAQPETYSKARALRMNMTRTEKILWEKLKSKRLNNYKFRRQHPILNFIADFYCHELRLIIEVDGRQHNKQEQLEYDKKRTSILNFQGIKILRFTNDDILTNIQYVKHKILIAAERIKSH